jgi:acylphosphatase
VTTVADDTGNAANCTLQAAAGTGTDPSCSLRDALLFASTSGSGNISFDGTVFSASNSVAANTITLTKGALNIPSNTGITFGPATIKVATGSGPPLGLLVEAIDNVTFSTTVGQTNSVKVDGWVADPQDGAPLSNVTVYIDGNSVGAPTLGLARPNVATTYHNNAYLNSGYQLLYSASSLVQGTHHVTVVAVDSAGRSTTFGPRTFTVAANAGLGSPLGGLGLVIDSVTSSTTISHADSLKVTGWVADPQDGSPLSNVQVYVDGTPIGTPTLGIVRSDIAATYGSTYLHSGYRLLYPASSLALGTHLVTVVAIDSGGRSITLGPRTITVQ